MISEWFRRHWHGPKVIVITFVVAIAAVDISGTPIAIFSLKRAENNFNHSTHQVIKARHDDCVEAEVLRARGRARVAKERREYKKNLMLLKLKDSKHLKELAEQNYRASETQLAPRDCFTYANRAG